MRALLYLHQNRVIHADIKLENCLFKNRGELDTLRVVDFGLAMQMTDDVDSYDEMRGTLSYMSPEILQN